MKTAAQRAAKRLRRELRKGPVGMSDPARPIARPASAKFHRFYLPVKAQAEEMVLGLNDRGRDVKYTNLGQGDLPWMVMLRADDKEIMDPALYADRYQTFAEKFGGEYGGML